LYNAQNSTLVVTDFGIAHFTAEELYTLVETGPHTRLANFQYAAPEQRSRGAVVDQRADIYSLSLILNELFTGQMPHGTDYKTIATVAPDYAYLDDLVAEMLRQDPNGRPQSIEHVKNQLIGRGHEFLEKQRLDALKRTVVSTKEVTDPLISDPLRLVAAQWDDGNLTLKLSQPVNERGCGRCGIWVATRHYCIRDRNTSAFLAIRLSLLRGLGKSNVLSTTSSAGCPRRMQCMPTGFVRMPVVLRRKNASGVERRSPMRNSVQASISQS